MRCADLLLRLRDDRVECERRRLLSRELRRTRSSVPTQPDMPIRVRRFRVDNCCDTPLLLPFDL